MSKGIFKQLIQHDLFRTWFDKLTTNGINQRFPNEQSGLKLTQQMFYVLAFLDQFAVTVFHVFAPQFADR
jgi:hypothetical protein